jgi:hypothetical protein
MHLESTRVERQRQGEQLSKLQSCLRGNAFVEYIAEEQLMQVSQAASQRPSIGWYYKSCTRAKSTITT